jgi:GFO/IDH/MocA oxidoreductase family protein
MIRFAVAGTGFRAEAFLRVADLLPDRMAVVGVVGRNAEKRAFLSRRWRVPAFPDLAALLRHEAPDFLVTAVTPEANADLVSAAVALDMRVLSETPPASGADALDRLWSQVGASGLVQVAEQYARQPMNAARLALLRNGTIGRVTSAEISMTQLYHAVSLLRIALDVGFEDAEVRAGTFTSPLMSPRTRAGWTGEDSPQDLATTLATVDFNGAVGRYDFTETQTRNPLRTSRFLARGSHGELVNDRVVHLVCSTAVVESPLVRRQTGQHEDFEVPDLEHVSFEGSLVYTNAYYGARLSDEDIAVAAVLEEMGRWSEGNGPAPYPLADAAQDAMIASAITHAAETGAPVRTVRHAWARR